MKQKNNQPHSLPGHKEFRPFPAMTLHSLKLEAINAINKHFVLVLDLVKNVHWHFCLSEHGHALHTSLKIIRSVQIVFVFLTIIV